jgi:hypothetical protein
VILTRLLGAIGKSVENIWVTRWTFCEETNGRPVFGGVDLLERKREERDVNSSC